MSDQNFTSLGHVIAKKSSAVHHTPPKAAQISHPPEAEPMSTKKSEVIIHEVVEHEVKDPQVKPHVEVKKDIPVIPQDLQKVGVQTTASSSFVTNKALKLPLDEEKIPEALRAPPYESFRWLGKLSVYLWEQSQALRQTHENILKNLIKMIGRDFGS